MTRLIGLHELYELNALNGIYGLVTKETYNQSDKICAQSVDSEKWFSIDQIIKDDGFKKGYSILVLTEKEVS